MAGSRATRRGRSQKIVARRLAPSSHRRDCLFLNRPQFAASPDLAGFLDPPPAASLPFKSYSARPPSSRTSSRRHSLRPLVLPLDTSRSHARSFPTQHGHTCLRYQLWQTSCTLSTTLRLRIRTSCHSALGRRLLFWRGTTSTVMAGSQYVDFLALWSVSGADPASRVATLTAKPASSPNPTRPPPLPPLHSLPPLPTRAMHLPPLIPSWLPR